MCRNYLPLFVLSLLLFFATTSTGQPRLNSLKFITYTTEDGLADNYVVKTLTDEKGFLWVATRNGLSRFDGLHFTNYTVDNPTGNGLRSTWITDLALDGHGTLWVSTEWGICYYNEEAARFCYMNDKNNTVVLYKAPLFACGNVLWMACESGLLKINTQTKSLRTTSLKKISDPQSICADAKGSVWIGTRGHGLFCYEPATDTWKTVQPPVVPANAHYVGLYKDAACLWATTNKGLLALPAQGQPALYNAVEASDAATVMDELMFATPFPPLTGDSLLFCGTYNKRIALFNKRTKKFTAPFTGSNAQLYGIPHTIFNSGQSAGTLLWLGTDKGLTMLNTQAQDFTTFFLEGLGKDWSKTLVKKLLPFDDSANKVLLLLNNPGGVALYNRARNKVERLWQSPQQGRKYSTAIVDKGANLWLLYETGIDRFSPRRGIRPVYSSTTRTFFGGRFDDEGLLWIGADDGLLRYDVSRNRADYFPVSFNGTAVENTSFPFSFFTKDVCPDNRGRIWMASLKYGLFCFDKATQRFACYRQPSGAAYETKNRCDGLLFDKAGKLWVSTLAGLTYFDTAAKTVVNYSHQQGLQSNYVYAIASHTNGIIAGRGNGGVFLFNTATKKFTNYAVPIQMSSELLEQQVSVINDDFYVGFGGGFSVYRAAPAATAKTLPVFITDCMVNNEREPGPLSGDDQTLHLNYRQNGLQIAYACVNYDRPGEVTYRYRLAGSKEWTNAGTQRTVSYTDLPAGSYTFAVMATGPDGAQSTLPASLRFIIHPPFWETLWFRLCLVLFTGGVLLFGFSYRIKQIKKGEAQKTAVNKSIAELEMKALRSQMNPHFIFNSLNSIQKYIWEARQEDAAEYLTKFARLIRAILENSAYKLVPLYKEIESLKLYLELEHRRSNQKFDYTIILDEALDADKVMIPPLLLQPYIENAIWHGLNPKKGRGELIISIRQKKDTLVCIVEDNGIGRQASKENKTKQHTSMGLNISYQRISLLQKESGIETGVSVWDKTDDKQRPAGTVVKIVLPSILHHA